MSKPFLSLILPAHNEAGRLACSLSQVKAFVNAQNYESEVLLVENASTDETLKIAKSFLEDFPQLKIIQLEQAGKGNAIRTGMLQAEGQYRFMADVDFSMPIEEINKFLPTMLENPQLAIASRENPVQNALRAFYRHLIGRSSIFGHFGYQIRQSMWFQMFYYESPDDF